MSATETMTTPAAETPAPVVEKAALPAFDYTFSGAYTVTKAAYAMYMPIVAAALIVTYVTKFLTLLPAKVAALESLETLDAFLVALLSKADTKFIEVKGQAVTKVRDGAGAGRGGGGRGGRVRADRFRTYATYPPTHPYHPTIRRDPTRPHPPPPPPLRPAPQYETVKGDVDVKVTEVKAKVETYKGQAVAKVEEVKAKGLELKETAEAKYDEVKVITAKKVEQTKVVAQKVKVVAVETATALKSEIEKDGLVVVATKAGEVAKEQVVAAVEVVKAEGVKTLVENVTTAVIEKVNEVPLAEAEVEVEVEEEPAPVAAAAPAPVAAAAPAPVAVPATGSDEQ